MSKRAIKIVKLRMPIRFTYVVEKFLLKLTFIARLKRTQIFVLI